MTSSRYIGEVNLPDRGGLSNATMHEPWRGPRKSSDGYSRAWEHRPIARAIGAGEGSSGPNRSSATMPRTTRPCVLAVGIVIHCCQRNALCRCGSMRQVWKARQASALCMPVRYQQWIRFAPVEAFSSPRRGNRYKQWAMLFTLEHIAVYINREWW